MKMTAICPHAREILRAATDPRICRDDLDPHTCASADLRDEINRLARISPAPARIHARVAYLLDEAAIAEKHPPSI